jgi:hypothetical protein
MNNTLRTKVAKAIQGYLQTKLESTMLVVRARTDQAISYPVAVVLVGPVKPVSEDALYNPYRQMEVSIIVETEAAAIINTAGSVLKTAEDRHDEAVTAVESLLEFTNEDDPTDTLPARLNSAQAPDEPGALFTQAQYSGDAPSDDQVTRRFKTIIELYVIANA